MHHRLTEEAAAALDQLEQGAVMNCMHTVARELIAAGLAIDGWGKLEITEAGRRVTRQSAMRSYVISDPNIANMGDRNEPFSLPPLAPDLPLDPVKFSEPQMRSQKLAWSRHRAARAAGIANGATEVWVEPRWVEAFMDAYEREE